MCTCFPQVVPEVLHEDKWEKDEATCREAMVQVQGEGENERVRVCARESEGEGACMGLVLYCEVGLCLMM